MPRNVALYLDGPHSEYLGFFLQYFNAKGDTVIVYNDLVEGNKTFLQYFASAIKTNISLKRLEKFVEDEPKLDLIIILKGELERSILSKIIKRTIFMVLSEDDVAPWMIYKFKPCNNINVDCPTIMPIMEKDESALIGVPMIFAILGDLDNLGSEYEIEKVDEILDSMTGVDGVPNGKFRLRWLTDNKTIIDRYSDHDCVEIITDLSGNNIVQKLKESRYVMILNKKDSRYYDKAYHSTVGLALSVNTPLLIWDQMREDYQIWGAAAYALDIIEGLRLTYSYTEDEYKAIVLRCIKNKHDICKESTDNLDTLINDKVSKTMNRT